MGPAGESGGVAGRAELPGARGPDHPAVCCAVPRRKVRGRGAGLGRAVWPEGRELKLYTAWERIVPLLRRFPFPLPPPSLNPLARAPRERSGPEGRGERACRGGAGAQAGEGRCAECKAWAGGHARPRTFSNPQCPHLDPRRSYRTAPPPSLFPLLCGFFIRSPSPLELPQALGLAEGPVQGV